MGQYLRLRQICLVAPALGPAEANIEAVLGVPVCHRDPNVAPYGLENALFALGPDILEVVAPTREGTAAGRFIQRSGGRGGYMAIFDCDDAAARRARAEAIGVRTANLIQHDDYLGVQLHPRDCRAAMLEFNTTAGGEALDGPYHPAGPDWTCQVRPLSLPRLLAAEIVSPDPAGLAAHWARIMGVAPTAGPSIRLVHGLLDFVPGEAERLDGLRIALPDPAAARMRAARRGLPVEGDAVLLAGVRMRLLPADGVPQGSSISSA
jgi:hypothetical protein